MTNESNEDKTSDATSGRDEPVVMCECISGKSLLNTFNNQPFGETVGYKTLEEHIDIAISMAMQEAAEKQIYKCVEAIKGCDQPRPKRIRIYEAIGAVVEAKLYT